MKNVTVALLVLFLCSCASYPLDNLIGGAPGFPSYDPEPVKARCSNVSATAVRTRQQYEDYYGTMITSDSSSLRTPAGTYRYGITNPTPLSMAYFAAYLKPASRYNYFRTKIYIDGGIKAPMVFLFRNGDRNGEVLKSVTIHPGQTREVDFEIAGVRKMYAGSELRINHDRAVKIIIGEPEFYNCR